MSGLAGSGSVLVAGFFVLAGEKGERSMPIHEVERYSTEGWIIFGDGTSVQVKDAIVEIGDTGPADDCAEDAGVYGRLGEESIEFSVVLTRKERRKFEKLFGLNRNRIARSVRYTKRFKERVRRAELKGEEKITIGRPWMLRGLLGKEVWERAESARCSCSEKPNS